MCGIFAVLGLTGDPAVNRRRVYNLAKRIRHRGPDSYNMDVRIDEAAGKGGGSIGEKIARTRTRQSGGAIFCQTDPSLGPGVFFVC
jgi:asparagine synthase (glutamine-hydrolysing)